MEKRILIIKNEIINTHYYYYKKYNLEKPKSLQLLAKHFYKKNEINIILDFIKKDEKSDEYFYKSYNKNDGLVFTPNLYQFKPGNYIFFNIY
jgi:hypothetical protein